MKIKSFFLKNFLSFSSKGYSFENLSNLNIFIGPNNSGKTNIIRTILFIKDFLENHKKHFGISKDLDIKSYIFDTNEKTEFDIHLEFELNDTEIRSFESLILHGFAKGSYMEYLRPNPKNPRISEVNEGELVKHYEGMIEKLRPMIRVILSRGIGLEVNYSGVFGELPKMTFFLHTEFGDLKTNESDFWIGESEVHSGPLQYVSSICFDMVERKTGLETTDFTIETWKNFLESLDNLSLSPKDLIDSITGNEAKFINVDFKFPANNRYGQEGTVHPFEEDLRIFTSENDIEEITGLTQMFSLLFSRSIVYLPEKGISDNSNNNINKSTTHTSISASNLPNILFKLQNSPNFNDLKTLRNIQKIFGEIADGLEFYVASRNSNESADENSAQDVDPVIYVGKNDKFIVSDFSSSGLMDILIASTALSFSNDRLVILDEPGSALHPFRQRIFNEKLKEFAEDGSSQYFMITHSSYMFDLSEPSKIFRIFQQDGTSEFIDFWKEIDKIMESRQVARITFSDPKIKSLLYSSGVILVEGLGEELTISLLDQFFSIKEKTKGLQDLNWTLLPVGGKTGFASHIKLVSSMKLPFFCIADNDALMEIPNSEKGVDHHLSAIFWALTENDKLDQNELKIINRTELSQNKYGKNRNFVYTSPSRSSLLEIANSHGFTVLDSDLEGLLGVKSSKKKILKDLNSLESQLKANTENPLLNGFYLQLMEKLKRANET